MEIKENVLLAPLTTFGIGGVARFFISVKGVDELNEALDFAWSKKLPVLILGGGSNILIPDKGWGGVVLKIEITGVELQQGGEKTLLVAGAGENWDSVVAKTVSQNLWGIENLSGIPGTVGGAVVQNIGAYGTALSETLLWVEVMDETDGAVRRFSNSECAFDYRDSFLKHDKGRYVVLRAAFGLSKEPKPNVSYKDLATRFNDSSLDIKAVRDAVFDIRRGKFPNLEIEGTAGSFFKNPIVSADEAKKLKDKYPEMPLFSMPETSGTKVPLAWLLDNVLSLKGESVGGARLYEKQPLVIAAQKNTSADDVKALMQKIKKEVKNKLHLIIEEEVKII